MFKHNIPQILSFQNVIIVLLMRYSKYILLFASRLLRLTAQFSLERARFKSSQLPASVGPWLPQFELQSCWFSGQPQIGLPPSPLPNPPAPTPIQASLFWSEAGKLSLPPLSSLRSMVWAHFFLFQQSLDCFGTTKASNLYPLPFLRCPGFPKGSKPSGSNGLEGTTRNYKTASISISKLFSHSKVFFFL